MGCVFVLIICFISAVRSVSAPAVPAAAPLVIVVVSDIRDSVVAAPVQYSAAKPCRVAKIGPEAVAVFLVVLCAKVAVAVAADASS